MTKIWFQLPLTPTYPSSKDAVSKVDIMAF